MSAHLRAIWRAALASVDPARLVAAHVRRRGTQLIVSVGGRRLVRPVDGVWVVAVGKAAMAMGRALGRLAPAARGIAVAPREPARRGQARVGQTRIGRIRVLHGEHPVPGPGSFAAGRELVAGLRRTAADSTVLLLLSGGASALLAHPARGVSARDKARLGRLLVRAGLPVADMNVVRKHVSALKGGGLLRLAAPREVITLALSDVPGDDLATIGSGPAVADPSRFADALAALSRVARPAALPPGVRARLERGVVGAADETVKPGDPLLARAHAAVVGSNRLALEAAARRARRLGYSVRVLPGALCGEASACATRLARRLSRRPARPTCVLAGGETVVRAGQTRGRGGRSQELALALASHIAGTKWTVLAAGTDGIDGETPAAGAICDGGTLERAGSRAIARALADHDSHGFFRRHGGLFVTGPTGTNVMDVLIALHPGGGGRGRRPVVGPAGR